MNTLLDLNANSAPITAKRAKEIFEDSRTLFYTKVKEIKEQVKKGRYSKYAVLDDGKVRVNYFVYYDYCTYRRMLNDKNASKYAPPFEPKEIAEITPISVLHHFADKEDN